MQKAFVIGIGQIKIGEHWDKSPKEMAGEAALLALSDANFPRIDALFIGNMMAGTANKQLHLNSLIADWIGFRGNESIVLESACSSGAAAFRAGILALASGQIETALIVGVEKMTDSPSSEITNTLSTAADADLEVDMGVSFVALNALLMRRYMHEYGWKNADFAGFSINAHANAVSNPNARFRKPISEKNFIESGMICDPINLMDASSIGDGSAALVITNNQKYLNKKQKISVVGSSANTDTISLQTRGDPIWLTGAEKSSRDAYKQAGITSKEVNVFEYHDAFSIMAALSLEASGFAERGKGPQLAIDGEIKPNGRIPVATKGGLKARGHPVGATGVYQLVEVVQQLRGEAGDTQVSPNIYGMAQNIGGSGSNIITHILKRE